LALLRRNSDLGAKSIAMNTFDAVVLAVTLIAILMGFNAGLLRSVATIVGYLIAAPIAIKITPAASALVTGQAPTGPDRTWWVMCGLFVVTGVLISALLRYAVSEFTGRDVNLLDRIGGGVFGAIRIGLVAVLVVLVFDRIIPADRQPPFLADSRLRPMLSLAGHAGLKSLPPDVAEFIDQLKRERGI
jgi:membrane protein required for colicin V production